MRLLLWIVLVGIKNIFDNHFPNLSIIHIPPYSPELNPIEQVWSWMRQNEIANRVFKDYEDIVDKCTSAWNNFRNDTDRVISLCSRDWAKLTSSAGNSAFSLLLLGVHDNRVNRESKNVG